MKAKSEQYQEVEPTGPYADRLERTNKIAERRKRLQEAERIAGTVAAYAKALPDERDPELSHVILRMRASFGQMVNKTCKGGAPAPSISPEATAGLMDQAAIMKSAMDEADRYYERVKRLERWHETMQDQLMEQAVVMQLQQDQLQRTTHRVATRINKIIDLIRRAAERLWLR